MDERENKLPAWAKQTIADLRLRVANNAEPLARELVNLRPRVELLNARNGALMELLECAAKGGHITSQAIVETLRGYTLELIRET